MKKSFTAKLFLVIISFLTLQYIAKLNLQYPLGNLGGKGTQESPYLIKNENDYIIFANSVAQGNTYEGKYIQLQEDLDLSKSEIMIGTDENAFAGLFDGGGHRIKNFYIDMGDEKAGLFLNLDGVVCNVMIENGLIKGKYAGAIAGKATEKSRIYNCCSYAKIQGETVGGIVGKSLGEISNCVSCYDNMESDKNKICLLTTKNEEDICLQQEITEQTLSDDILFLNCMLDGLSIMNKYHNLNYWQKIDDKIVLSKERKNVLLSMVMQLKYDNNTININAFFGKDNEFYFTIPAGNEQDKARIEIKYLDGSIITSYIQITSEKNIIKGKDALYSISCCKTDNVGTAFIYLNEEKGIEYLSMSKDNFLNGNIISINEYGDVTYKGIIDRINGHGNDSWRRSKKKSYNLKLKEEYNLFNMGNNKEFVLVSGYRDNSLLSYKITEDMEKELGIEFAPESRFINLFVNNCYEGLYLITEKISISESTYNLQDLEQKTKEINRIKLSEFNRCNEQSKEDFDMKVWYDIKNNPKDITGGYIIEFNSEDYSENQSRFVSDHGITITLKSNTYASKEQVDYISEIWQNYEDAVFSEDGYNAYGKYYTDYIDITSFADQWLMYEFNSEGSMAGSVYFYKDSDVFGDGLIHAGYVWDVEHSFKYDPEMLFIPAKSYDFFSNYWGILYKHNDFAELVKEEWNKNFLHAVNILLQEYPVENVNGLSSLCWYKEEYQNVFLANEKRWPSCRLNEKVEGINDFVRRKSNFLSLALSYYGQGYDYFYYTNSLGYNR